MSLIRSGTTSPYSRSPAVERARIVTNKRAQEYRRRASECLELARLFANEKARATLLKMATTWSRLADAAVAPMRPEGGGTETRSVVQQQQQIQPDKDGKK